MHVTRQRRSTLGAAVACLLLLASCSSEGPAPSTAPSTTTSARTPTVSQTATAAVRAALVKTTALRSYSFSATQTLTGGPRTLLRGRVVRRPPATSYVLDVGGKVQEIVEVKGRTYRRLPPGPWRLLVKPAASKDPLTTLLALLSDLQQPTLTGNRLSGTIPTAAIARAQLAPAASVVGKGATATVDLSPDGHVSALTVRVSVRAGSATLQLLERIAFSGLNRAAAVLPPITHR